MISFALGCLVILFSLGGLIFAAVIDHPRHLNPKRAIIRRRDEQARNTAIGANAKPDPAPRIAELEADVYSPIADLVAAAEHAVTLPPVGPDHLGEWIARAEHDAGLPINRQGHQSHCDLCSRDFVARGMEWRYDWDGNEIAPRNAITAQPQGPDDCDDCQWVELRRYCTTESSWTIRQWCDTHRSARRQYAKGGWIR